MSAVGAQEAGGDERFHLIGCWRSTGFVVHQLIAGKLFQQEMVDGFILVERFDDVVAVLPERVARVVAGGAARIGIARDVQLVAAPMFAVVVR